MAPLDIVMLALVSLLVLNAVVFGVLGGVPVAVYWIGRQEAWFDRVLNRQLLMEVPPRTATILTGIGVVLGAVVFWLFIPSVVGALIGAAGALALPLLVVRHLEQKRREALERQLVDGITTLASGLRGGLTIVQAYQNLAENSSDPLRQEVQQILREYQMGLDLNAAMRNASERIGSPHYRLLFTALEMHRQRGGDAAESLDRLAESLREIQGLEGKLDALTSQGRYQAWAMLGAVPALLLAFYVFVDDQMVMLLFTDPVGRMLLGTALALSVVAFLWIRRIMAVDI